MSVTCRTFAAYTNRITPGNEYDASTKPLGYTPHEECVAGDGGRSPTEAIGQEGPATATRTLRCNWEDRWSLQMELLGGPLIARASGNLSAANLATFYTTSCATNDVVVFSPHRHPYWPYMVAKSVRMAPENGNTNKNTAVSNWRDVQVPAATALPRGWEKAILTVEYASPQAAPATGYGIFFEETVSPSTEFLTGSSNGLYWDNAATTPIDSSEAPGMQIKKFQLTLKRRKIPPGGLMVGQLLALQGCVNSDTVNTTLFSGLAAGTVLFEAPTFAPSILTDGGAAYDIDLHFRIMVGTGVNWNQFPHIHGTGIGTSITFDKIYNAAGTQFKPYPTAALANLFLGSYW